MKRVSIQVLKARLSALVTAVEAGDTVLITRHNDPVARLSPARADSIHHGAAVGAGRLKPAIRRHTKGRYLTVLEDDRGNR